MKIYRCNYYHADNGCVVSWHASKREAEQALRRQQKADGDDSGPSEVEVYNVTMTRAGLLDWLNLHDIFKTDNG